MAFRYNIIKKSIGNSPYTTRPDLSPALTQEEVIRQLRDFTSLTEGQIENVLDSLFSILKTAALAGRPTEILFNSFRIGATFNLIKTLKYF